MNYKKIYLQIINRAECEEILGVRKRHDGIYYEGHHPIPLCIKKEDNNKTVLLTGKEHFACHWLLVEIYPTNKKLQMALWCMIVYRNDKRDYRVSTIMYDRHKQLNTAYLNMKKHIKNSKWYNLILYDYNHQILLNKS